MDFADFHFATTWLALAAPFAGAPLEPAILIAAVREAATRVEDARRALGGAA